MISRGLHIGPSPNWYNNNVADCNYNNVIAYGAKSSICLIDASTIPPNYEALFVAHSDKVCNLKFCRNTKKTELLLSSAEDSIVKVWNIATRMCLNEIIGNQKTSCIEWLGASEDTVFLGYENGEIFMWKIDTDKTVAVKGTFKGCISALSSDILNPNILAVGFRGGTIVIMDVELGIILKRLKAHDNDILSLGWSEAEQDDAEVYLMSTSKDKTIKVWDLKEDKLCHTIHTPQQQIMTRRDDLNRLKMGVTGIWVRGSNHQIIVGFPSGEVRMLNLLDSTLSWKFLDTYECGGHVRCIFNILTSPDGLKAFTISQDRKIILWDLVNKCSIYALSTLGGFAYSLSFSPIESNRLAIGGGDNSLRVWNLSASNQSCFTFWQGIKGKVTALAWHPTKEGFIGFGTDEGKIGCIDITTNKPPIIASSSHRNTIYCICWGPYLYKDPSFTFEEAASNSLGLFSCGDGQIFIHLATNFQKEAKSFDLLVRNYVDYQNRPLQRTELAWKQDFTAVAIGNEDGSVEIYSRAMVLLARLEGPKKLIQCLLWHPLFVKGTKGKSNLHGWLACTSNEPTIYLYDLTAIVDIRSPLKAKERLVIDATMELVAHHFRVVALSWSPHQNGMLASSSYDSTVQVWNVCDNEPIANYQGHKGRLFSVEWSTLDPDLIFSGGEDCSVQQWRISECTEKLPPSKVNSKTKKAQKYFNELSEAEAVFENQKNVIMQFGPAGDLPDKSAVPAIISADGSGDSGQNDSKITVETSFDSRRESFSDDSSAQDSKQFFSKSVKTSKLKKETEIKKAKKKAQKSFFPITNYLDCSGKARGQEDCMFLLDYFYPNQSLDIGKKTQRKVSFSDLKNCTPKTPVETAENVLDGDDLLSVSSKILVSKDDNESLSLFQDLSIECKSNSSIESENIIPNKKGLDESSDELQNISSNEDSTNISSNEDSTLTATSSSSTDDFVDDNKQSVDSLSLSPASQNSSQQDAPMPSLLNELLSYVSESCPNKPKATAAHAENSSNKVKSKYLKKSSVVPPVFKPSLQISTELPQPNLGFFTNNVAARKVLAQEATHHRDNANFDYYSQMEVWQGNISNLLREAADQKKLNDNLLGLAPLGSTKLWREMCELYSQQLASEGNVHKAVLYLLASHHVHKAIQLFKSHLLFREAISLARARLSSGDQVINELYLAWANNADREGNYELAAKCYLCINLPVAAIKVLAKRTDASSNRVVALIAQRCQHHDEAVMYAQIALKEALLKGEWQLAALVIEENPTLEGLKLLKMIHKQVMQQQDVFSKKEAPEKDPLTIDEMKELQLEDSSEKGAFLDVMIRRWQEDGGHVKNLTPNIIKSASLKSSVPRNVREINYKLSLDLFQEAINQLKC